MPQRNKLLISDLHLTDNEREAYRWKVFESIEVIAIENDVDEIHILGDATDRKNFHGASLVNRFVRALIRLKENTGAEIFILMGNHDAPIRGMPFWEFLNHLGIYYITEPRLYQSVWLLPYSDNPLEDWKDFQLFKANALFMHQTVAGALVEGDRQLKTDSRPMPILPRGLPIFSGDVHRPQKVGGITYVGASHPVRFGEDWSCRCLLFRNDNFEEPISIYLPHIRRTILDVKPDTDVNSYRFRAGDQLRIRYHLTKDRLTEWPIAQEAIRAWANTLQLDILSMESILEDPLHSTDQQVIQRTIITLPEQIIRDFSEDQKLDNLTTEIGLELIQEAYGTEARTL